MSGVGISCMCCTDTPYCITSPSQKLMLQSGQFGSVLKTSLGSLIDQPRDISWDGENTPWSATFKKKLVLQSGQFTSTVKQSQDVTSWAADEPFTSTVTGISWDGTNTPWVDMWHDPPKLPKLFLQSGQFTSTLKTSKDVSAIAHIPEGISYSDGHTPWCGRGGPYAETDPSGPPKLFLQSGQFTSTMKTSYDVSSVASASIEGISWDGHHTPWTGSSGNSKLFLQSGQFTSTLRTSRNPAGGNISGINTSRLEVG